jgi:hypothetical protein
MHSGDMGKTDLGSISILESCLYSPAYVPAPEPREVSEVSIGVLATYGVASSTQRRDV